MKNMWPLLLDSSEEECMKTLRRLELEAYGCLVSALRAQGGLTSEKLKILKDTASALHITPERHRAEIRRAVNDEQLCTIAQFAEGPDTYAEWSVEGRRKVRLVPRVVPQTAFLAVARRVADVAQADNAKMPWPAATARPPISKIQSQTPSTQIKYDHEERISKKRRRLSDDSLPSPSQSSSQQSSQSIVYTTQSPGQQKHHRIQKHGISKIQQMYKNQSRLAASVLQRQQPSSSVAVSHQEIMPPPRTTIKTIPPVKQNKTSDISEKVPQVTTSPSVTALSTPITAKVIHQNKSLIKISTQNPTTHQKLVIVSASQPINSNIMHQVSSGGGGGNTNKIISSPINTIKIKTTVGGTVATIAGGSGDDLELKCSKITNQQVIVSKSQLTPLQTIHHGHHTHVSGGSGDTKSKVLTVQAKVRPQGSIIVPLQGQTATSSGQFAGVSVPVLQGVQWKAIQGKSTVKLLPISGNAKIIQKQGGTVGSAPIYVMSKPSNLLVNKSNDTETTKSTLSNITHIRPFTQKTDDANPLSTTGGSGKLLVVRKATPIITSTVSTTGSSPTVNITSSNEQSKSEDGIKETISSADQQRKSTVLQDALRASGVTAVDDDIESQISQYTVIPKTKAWTSDTTTMIDHHSHHITPQSASTQSLSSIPTQSMPSIASTAKSIQNIQLQDTKFLTLEEAVAILGDNSETRAILSHLQVESSNQTISTTDHGQLDPQTGIYSPIPKNNSSTSTVSSSSNISSTTSVNVISKQVNEQRLDIFNTALVTANIHLDSVGRGDSGGDEIITTSNNIEEQNSSTDEFYTDDNVIIDTTQLCPSEIMQTEDVVVTTTDEISTSLTDKQLTDILTGGDSSDNINDAGDNTNR